MFPLVNKKAHVIHVLDPLLLERDAEQCVLIQYSSFEDWLALKVRIHLSKLFISLIVFSYSESPLRCDDFSRLTHTCPNTFINKRQA